jgi:predicted amidophosphoribosyltransferase
MVPLARLLDFIFPPRESEVIVRTLSADALVALTSPELIVSTRPATTALLPFRDERVRASVHEAKYYASERAARLLGAVLRDYLVESAADAYGNIVIIPLPLSRARLRERGFNQCERIVREALRGDTLPCSLDTNLLKRVRDTEHQARLAKSARRANVAHAFATVHRCDPRITYLVFDDVITTGATLAAAMTELRKAGARRLLPLTLAS